ncbi:unnamed protein product [Closterium sp. NIES-64]|nr:unnamed protein product [Closterium sp. NIES-64]
MVHLSRTCATSLSRISGSSSSPLSRSLCSLPIPPSLSPLPLSLLLPVSPPPFPCLLDNSPACNVTTDAAPTYGNCSAVDNQRIKTWAWLTPHICAPLSEDEDLPADTHEPCPPCPSGQYSVEDSTTRTRLCHFCPPGLARNASVSKTDKACRKCPPGEVAVKALTMDHFELHRGKLPDGFVTGCSGDCGSLGWRVVNGKLDSGSNHGKSASHWTSVDLPPPSSLFRLSSPPHQVWPSYDVWLSYDMSMAVEGHVSFAYDVDVAERGTLQRGPLSALDSSSLFPFLLSPSPPSPPPGVAVL